MSATPQLRRGRWRFAWSLRTLIALIGVVAVLLAIVAPQYRPRPKLWENRRIHDMLAGDPTTEVCRLDANGPIKYRMNGAVVIRDQYPIADGPRQISREARARLFASLLDESSYAPFKFKYGTDWHYRIRVHSRGQILDFDIDRRTPCILVGQGERLWYMEGLSPTAQGALIAELDAALAQHSEGSTEE